MADSRVALLDAALLLDDKFVPKDGNQTMKAFTRHRNDI